MSKKNRPKQPRKAERDEPETFELLALPGWKVVDTLLSAWFDQFEAQGYEVVVTRESTGVSWIEVPALRLRGYAVMANQAVEAINFELHAPDPLPARQAVEAAAVALSWDVDDEQDTDDDDDN